MTDMLLTFHELCTFLKADEPTVLLLIEEGAIPPPVIIGDQLVRWVENDLMRWVKMGCPRFPPPTSEELTLIRTKHFEEKCHMSAAIDGRLAADQAERDK